MSPKTRRRLFLEQLEDRLTPSTTGVPWPVPGHLTLSFAPDGTSTGQQGSTLFHALNAVTSTYNWQLAVLTAYQTWAVDGNVNVAVVSDGGKAFGAPGLPQGDSRFGDIRVGMAPLAQTALANTAPFSWAGTTWAGDTLLNSKFQFGVNGVGGPYDLSTVMLHEAGLAFGMQDSVTDELSVMFNNYLGVRTSLSAADVADFQSLYGLRAPDAYQGTTGDNSFATAYALPALPATPDAPTAVQADLGRYGEAEFYKVTIPGGSMPPLTVNLTTAGISSLLADVTVYNSSQQVLASSSAVDPMNGNLKVTVPSAQNGGTYYVEVSGATTNVFSIGSYQLTLSLGDPHSTNPAPAGTFTPGTSPSTAAILPLQAAGALSFANYNGQINSPYQQDWFHVVAPPASGTAGEPLLLVAEAWCTDGGAPLHPQVQVWSAGPSPQLLATQVLENGQGVFTVQLPDVTAGGYGYDVVVEPLTPGGQNTNGHYFLGIDFSAGLPASQSQAAAGTLTAASPQEFSQITLNQNELWGFALSASTGGSTAAEEVQMQVYNASGQVIFTLIAYAGQPPSTGWANLPAGTYTVVYSAVAQQPANFATLAFDLAGENLSYPIAALLTPTVGGPAPTFSASPPSTQNPGGGTYTPPKYS